MSKRRKSRRFESPEMVKIRQRREADRRSMNKGLASISGDLETDSHDPNDELDLPDFSTALTRWKFTMPPASWWQQVSMPPSWFTPSSLIFGDAGPSIDTAKLEALKTVAPHKVERRMPDYVQVITAWRAWKVVYQDGEWRLKALGAEHVWKPKEFVQAECKTGHASAAPSHPAPAMDCNCGVWAFKELDNLVAAIGNVYGQIKVLGQVSLWGRVIETENGYRAEKAYPSELWLLDSSLEELGLIYDVPVRN